MKLRFDKHDFAFFCVLLVVWFIAIMVAIAGTSVEKMVADAKKPVYEEKLEVKDDIWQLSQSIIGCFDGKPSRYLFDVTQNKVELIVFDTEKKDFDVLVEWFKANFEVESGSFDGYYEGKSVDNEVFCSIFWSGKRDDMAQLTYVNIVDPRVISSGFWGKVE